MKRMVSYTLLFLGFFLLAVGLLARFYVYPNVKKAPLDTYSIVLAEGSGAFLDAETMQPAEPVAIRNTRVVKGDVEAGSDSVTVYDYTATTEKLNSQDDPINIDEERYAIDRKTTEVVHCCGENPQDHEGIFLKFPFDTRRGTYEFWNSSLDRTLPMDFEEVDKIDGLTVYRFEQVAEHEQIDTLELDGVTALTPDENTVEAPIMYSAETQVWVEPTTGTIVNGAQTATQVVENPDGEELFTLAITGLSYTDKTVSNQIDLARDGVGQLRIVGYWVPILGTAVGIVLMIVGLLLGARKAPARAGTPTPQAA